jgi:hypothetical protein
MKNSILNLYFEKMRIIELIRSTVKKENMDPNFNIDFRCDDEKVNKCIPSDLRKYVVM